MRNALAPRLTNPPALNGQNDSGAFRTLVGTEQWGCLPASVRRRFGRHLAVGESVMYLGEVASTTLTMVGWIWAQLLRAFGAPLPLTALCHSPCVVVVTGGSCANTQLWTRIYHEAGRLPQVIRSMKSFSGPTGLEECVNAGISMALTVSVESRALVFRSRAYQWQCGPIRLSIPLWLTPGYLEVRHREERYGRFSFELSTTHPWFGRIIHQVAYFDDAS
jgi:Domain of unknown function (DUF4166)